MTSLSHVLLAVNSSVNLLIYCLWNGQFRRVAKDTFLEACFPSLAQNRRRAQHQERMKTDSVMMSVGRSTRAKMRSRSKTSKNQPARSSPEEEEEVEQGGDQVGLCTTVCVIRFYE